jgi:2-oxoglutarate ferredoxin oxidoreductase subunit beta
MSLDLATDIKITWCPGCPNSQILVSFRAAIEEMVKDGTLELHNVVAGAGVGCHGKISDYLEVNTFNSLHGRVIPSLTGIKLANPALTVVGFSGDGDSFSEGFSHISHAARRNTDISIFLHNNQVFALTTGQATCTSPKGFKGGTTPQGSVDEPMDPVLIMLALGATFVARTYAGDITKTKEIMQAAMRHKGFAFVDIIQPCITFFDTREYYKERMVWLDDKHRKGNLDSAFKVARSTSDQRRRPEGSARQVPLGIIYQVERPTFESHFQ